MNTIETKHFECSCSSPDHIIRLVYIPENVGIYEEVYLDVQLNPTYSFFKRIWLAIKYILGYSKKYGHWDCTLIKYEDYDDIIALFQRAKRDHKFFIKREEERRKGINGKAIKNK